MNRKIIKHAKFFLPLIILGFLLFSCFSQLNRQKFEELETPTSPYFDNALVNVHILDKEMLKDIMEKLEIDQPGLLVFIEEIKMSVRNNGTYSLLVGTKKINFRTKLSIMKKIGAEHLDSQWRYWKYVDEENGQNVTYFDISYKDAIVIKNFEDQDIEKDWTWKIPKVLDEVGQEKATIDACLWGGAKLLGTENSLGNFRIDWLGMVITDYQKEDKMESSLLISFDGGKAAKATLKFMMPLFLGMLNVSATDNVLSSLDFRDNVLLIDAVLLDKNILYNFL